MLTGRRKFSLWSPVRATPPLPPVHNRSPRMEKGGLLCWQPTILKVCSPLTRSILTLPLLGLMSRLLGLMSLLLVQVIQQTKHGLRTARRQPALATDNTRAVLMATRRDLHIVGHTPVRHPALHTTTRRAHWARLAHSPSITRQRRGGFGFPLIPINCMMGLILCGLATEEIWVLDNPNTQNTLDTCALAMITLATNTGIVDSSSGEIKVQP